MIVRPVAWRLILAVLLVVCLPGCIPHTETTFEEEKDPNFLEGKTLVMGRDYRGAIEAFERALRANPNSASAHHELGVLYQQEGDPTSSVYHFERFVRLKPKSEKAELAKQQITACKIDLAKQVTYGVVTREVQRDMEKLTTDNRALRQQIEALRLQLAQKPAFVTNHVTNFLVSTQYVAQAGAGLTSPPQPQAHSGPAAKAPAPKNPTPAQPDKRKPEPAPSRPTTHVVRAGETPSSIASRYGISVPSLMAANPGLNARKLHAGQVINVPAKR